MIIVYFSNKKNQKTSLFLLFVVLFQTTFAPFFSPSFSLLFLWLQAFVYQITLLLFFTSILLAMPTRDSTHQSKDVLRASVSLMAPVAAPMAATSTRLANVRREIQGRRSCWALESSPSQWDHSFWRVSPCRALGLFQKHRIKPVRKFFFFFFFFKGLSCKKLKNLSMIVQKHLIVSWNVNTLKGRAYMSKNSIYNLLQWQLYDLN